MLTLSTTPAHKALAMIEFSSIAAGVTALDAITKTAEVDILAAQTICPGKYMIIFCGGISEVNASLEATRKSPTLIDEFLLGRPHPDIFAALNSKAGVYQIADSPQTSALGLLETYSGAAAIKAADTAAKTSWVTLAEIHIAHGMCGKSTVLITGDIAAVAAALDAASNEAISKSQLLDTALIPNPDKKMIKAMGLG